MSAKTLSTGLDSSGGNGVEFVDRYSFGATSPYKEGPATIKKEVAVTKACVTTPVTAITDAEVGANRRIVEIFGFIGVNGATAWTDATATLVKLQDTAGTPVVWMNIAKAALVANAKLSASGGTSFTMGAGAAQGYLTQGKGVTITADADFANGSNLKCTLFFKVEPV